MGSQLTKNFEVERDPKSEGGIGSPWKIYSAFRRDRDRTSVSIFTFDKRALEKKPDKELILQRLRQEVTSLMKLRHPNVLQVLEQILEDKTTLAWVSEPIEYCLGDLLRRPHILSACLDDTESRLGLLDVIQGLSFLHNEVRLVHMSVCPDNIYISQSGKWKIGGLTFATNYTIDSPGPLDPSIDIITSAKSFRFQADIEKVAPLLHFTAPEVVSKKSGQASSDIFSLGCSTFAIYKALSNTSSDLLLLNIEDFSVSGHRNACLQACHMGNPALNCLPDNLGETIVKMVSINPAERATLHELSVSRGLQTPYVKTIYYLEHLQEKQDAQKMQFFKGLTNIIDKFDKVIMHKRLLPALISSMQHPNLTPFILPSILKILKSKYVSRETFQSKMWKSIAKLVSGKEIPAQSFYLILSEIDLLISFTEIEDCKKVLIPLVFKGYECGVAQIQSTIMEKTPQMIKELQDINYVKVQILPRFLQGIINSKSSSVKEIGLKSLAQIYNSFDRATMVETIIPSLEKFKKFDITGIMIMHLLEVYEGISKVLGHKATAINILPALLPLLIEAELTKAEFEKLFCSIMNMMNLIKEMRSGELAEHKEEPIIENLKEAEIEEVNDIFRDIFDVSSKPVMEAPYSNNENNVPKPEPIGFNRPEPVGFNKPEPIGFNKPEPIGFNKPEPIGFNKPEPAGFNKPDIYKFEVLKSETKVGSSKNDPFKDFKTNIMTSKSEFANMDKNTNDFVFDSFKRNDPQIMQKGNIRSGGGQNVDLFKGEQKSMQINNFSSNKTEQNKNPVFQDLFAELASKPREELKVTGTMMNPSSTNQQNKLDYKPGSLKPQLKKPAVPAKINTDDFFNEFLNVNNKKDPFAGL